MLDDAIELIFCFMCAMATIVLLFGAYQIAYDITIGVLGL